MENKLFWKVLYEHLERAATYAGKSPLLSVVIIVTKLMVNCVAVFHVPKFMCDGGIQNQYYCHVQGRSGGAGKEAVFPVLNTKEQMKLQEGVADCGKSCSSFIVA